AGGGNASLVADPTWTPLATTPAHPEYPAAHGCVSTGVVDAMASFFHTDTFTFSMDSTVTMTTHTFSHFSDAGAEAGIARIYGSTHYLNSSTAGQTMGHQVVANMNAQRFLGHGDGDDDDEDGDMGHGGGDRGDNDAGHEHDDPNNDGE